MSCFFVATAVSKEIVVSPGENAHERLQEAMILMSEGDTLVIKSGYYSFEDGLSLDVDNVIITGEGGSGGALAIGVGDHISMLQYSIYSVASPEACASIVWRDGTKAQEAAEAMKLDAKNLLDFGFNSSPWGAGRAPRGPGRLLWGPGRLLWGPGRLLWGAGRLLWGSGRLLWGTGRLLWRTGR